MSVSRRRELARAAALSGPGDASHSHPQTFFAYFWPLRVLAITYFGH